MKTTTCFLTTLLFSSIQLLLLEAKEPEPVRESSLYKNPIVPNTSYDIMPWWDGPSGGGLSPTFTFNASCPISVQKEIEEINKGMPVRIRPLQEPYDIVYVNASVEISFDPTLFYKCYKHCVDSTKFMVAREEKDLQWSVVLGNPSDHPHNQTMDGTFKIDVDHGQYRLMFYNSDGVAFIVGTHAYNIFRRVLDLYEPEKYPLQRKLTNIRFLKFSVEYGYGC